MRKKKIESLIKLAEMYWLEYSDRRSVEWKVNFGLWAALGIFGGFVYQQKIILHLWIVIPITIGLLGIWVVYIFWKKEIQGRNTDDKNVSHA